MERAFKYLEYLKPDTMYYEKPEPATQDYYQVAEQLPTDWSVNLDHEYWTMYDVKDYDMPVQGFKIHISTTLAGAQQTLDTVAKLMFAESVPFKHVNHRGNLFNNLSKHGPRATSGKFITIYPQPDNFVPLMDKLKNVLSAADKGPYILNDRQYQESNVYYRYGGFRHIVNEKGEHCIYNPHGELVPDQRGPKFYLPEWVSLPPELLESAKPTDKPATESPLKAYQIDSVIRFSNAGGIYKATRKSDSKKVIIKEARANVGLDSSQKNSLDRLNIEYDALTKLKDVDGVVQLVDCFKVWEHTFLVEAEVLESTTLHQWMLKHYPFNPNQESQSYFEQVMRVLHQLECIVATMHAKGVAMCDLQNQNILIDEQDKLTLIDFEAAEEPTSTNKAGLATRGYTHHLNQVAADRDWYAVNRILHTLLMPIGPVYDLDMSLNAKHNLWIKQQFGADNFERFMQIQLRLIDKLAQRQDIFGETYAELSSDPQDPADIQEELLKGLLTHGESWRDSFINGDIRQYETDAGKLNIQNGGFGAVLAMARVGKVNLTAHDWIETVLPSLLSKNTYNNGLLTGNMGIANTLWEVGYMREAKQLTRHVINNYDVNSNDITLRSGLAGIGLGLASMYARTGVTRFLREAQKITNTVLNKSKDELVYTDWDSTSIGLLDGYAGVSLFLTYMYQITGHKKYLGQSLCALRRELKNAQPQSTDTTTPEKNTKQQKNPSLASGGVGIAVAIEFLNQVTGQLHFATELSDMLATSSVRMVAEVGLFSGAAGSLLLPVVDETAVLADAMDKLHPYLITKKNQQFVPGKGGYRLSMDVQTGTAGLILGMAAAESNNLLTWLPVEAAIQQQVAHAPNLSFGEREVIAKPNGELVAV